MTIPAVGAPPLNQVVTDMLSVLSAKLPPSSPPLPDPNVTVASVDERMVGLGNRRGNEQRSGLPLIALKGGRLDAVVTMQLWANSPGDADTAVLDLQKELLRSRDELRALGFLQLSFQGHAGTEAPLAEHVAALNAWRKSTSVRLLYEYHYSDADAAHSLIARIPIHADPEERASANRETTLVSDEMVRWDNERAPVLSVHGPARLGRLTLLSFVAGTPPGGTVSLLRTFTGAPGPPTPFASLTAFLAAIGGDDPAQRHARLTFASPAAFIAALDPVVDSIELGDWDLDLAPDEYQIRDRPFAPGVHLPAPADHFTLSYQHAALDQTAVFYLRLIPV